MKGIPYYGPLAVLGVLALAVLAFAVLRPIEVLPRIRLAPGFALVDQSGARLTSEDLRGSLVVYTLGTTACATPCPETQAVLREIQERLPAIGELDGIPVRLVTIVLDAAPDSPAALRAAAAGQGADSAVWWFATGDSAALRTLVGGGFEAYYAARPEGVVFDPIFFLVDGWGILRAEYRYGIPEPAALLADLRLVGREVRASEGIARFAYEAAHLFACYP